MAEVNLHDHVIDRIRSGDDSAIRELYRKTKPSFLAWAQKQFGIGDTESVEIFQMSVVILYDQIATGKLKSLSSSITTYLFAIGKNKAREYLRANDRSMSLKDGIHNYLVDEETEVYEKEELINKVEAAIHHLGNKCRDILRLFYYQKMSMDDIAGLLNYSSRGTAKNMKYKCLEKLRKLMQSREG